MTTDTAPNGAPRTGRRWLIGRAAVAAAAALWCGGWLIAARQAGDALDDWLLAEAAMGRQWTCPGRRIGGFPLALAVFCDRPTFRGEVAGHVADGIVEGLSTHVGLDDPGQVRIDLRPPLNLRAEDGVFALEVSWETMVVTLQGVLRPPDAGSLEAERLAVTVSTLENGDANFRAAHLAARAAPGPDQPGDKGFSFAVGAVTFPTLDPLPGLDAPLDAAGQGVLSHADLLQAPTVARLEAWRLAGGRLDLAGLSVRKGAFSGTAKGTLGLDPLHRAAGKLEASLAGFGPIAQRYGIPVAGVQLGGLLTSLLGGKAAPSGQPGAVQLPLLLADGRLAVGPFPTGLRLTPIY